MQESITGPVVLYVRVSSDKQRELHTIDGQKQALRDYCQRQNISISEVYQDDGVNGDLPFLSRPGGCRLLSDAQAGKFKTALVYLYDRFSRDVYEGIHAARALKASGVLPFSINEPYDLDTPHGQYMFVNSLNNAQLVKSQLLQRTSEGRERKVSAGYWVGGSAPFGYRIIGKSGRRTIEPDEETMVPGILLSCAETVRWIFRQVAHGGMTFRKVAEHLNAIGAPTYFTLSKRNTSGSHSWQPTAICRIIHSRTYIGTYTYGKVQKGANPTMERLTYACPPLVPVDLWEAAQVATKRNATQSIRNCKTDYLLRGLLRCGLCGRSYTGRNRERDKRHCYACIGAYGVLSNYGVPCQGRALNSLAEETVWQEVVSLLTDEEKTRETIARFEQREASGEVLSALEAERQSVETALVAKERVRAKLLQGWRDGLLTDAELKAQRGEVDNEESALRERIGEIQKRMLAVYRAKESARAAEGILLELRGRLLESPDALTFAARRQIVSALIESITVHSEPGSRTKRDINLTIHWRF